MAMSKHRLQRLGQPVRIHSTLDIIQFVGIRRQPAGRRFSRVILVVKPGTPFQLQFFGRIKQVVICQIRIFHFVISIVGDAQLARFRCFRLHDNYTIGSLRSINSHRRSIFQQSDTGNLGRIQVHNLCHAYPNDTIQHEQRLIGTSIHITTHNNRLIRRIISHAGLSTHIEIRNRARIGTGNHTLFHPETGVKHLNGVQDISRSQFTNLLTGHPISRTGKPFFLPFKNTCHHHFIYCMCVIFHHNSKRFPRKGNRYLLHTDISKMHSFYLFAFGHSNRKLPIHIGSTAYRRVVRPDIHPGKRLPINIFHLPCDFLCSLPLYQQDRHILAVNPERKRKRSSDSHHSFFHRFLFQVDSHLEVLDFIVSEQNFKP